MTFIAHNPASSVHDVPGHPETARRAEAILAAFDSDPEVRRFPRVTPDRALTRDEALRVHTPRLWLNLENMDRQGPAYVDPDTYMVAGSFQAAVTTARLAQQAVERCLGTGESGFVVARPPGHHATADRSMGFCLLNNVALAAQYALDVGAKRVLAFDHDVHHGNGTQEIFYRSPNVLYESFHLWPHYPGTGSAEETGEGEGLGFTANAPLDHGDGDAEVREVLLNVFLPIAKDFRPDVILVSSGFDSLEGDPLGGLRLSAPFYGEMVRRFRAVCDRVVCFLEGGYQLDRIPGAALEEVRALAGHAGPVPDEVHSTGAARRLAALLHDRWPGVHASR